MIAALDKPLEFKTMKSMRRCLQALFCLFLLGQSPANAACTTPECSHGGWGAANVIRLAVRQPGIAPAMTYTMTLPDPLNLSIDLDMTQAGRHQEGTLKLVDGQVLLMRGFAASGSGYEIDLLDGPILTYQLLLALLGRIQPAGPDALKTTRKINYTEKQQTLEVATPSATGTFPPPWTVTGTLTRKDKTSLRYALHFAYRVGGQNASMQLDGEWLMQRPAPQIDDAMPLAGWQSYRLGMVDVEQDGRTVQDYVAQPMQLMVGTLGDLRSVLFDKKPGGL